jgi:hypothetical protein
MATIIGILASVIATWVVAHIYYRRGTRDLQRIIDNLQAIVGKLPDSFATKLADEQRRKLSLRELEELIEEAEAYPTEFGLFPTKCPICGGEVEIRGSDRTAYSEPEAWPYCPTCDKNL